MFTMPRALPRQVTAPVVSVLIKLHVTPNMLTVAQLIGGIIAAYVIGSGELALGGLLLLLASALDAFDGTLARTTGRATKFGGVFDSTIDRLFEGAVMAGVLYFYLDRGAKEEVMLTFVAIVGSICVSYVRARAEVEGVTMYDGLFTRVVRIVILTAGLLAAEAIELDVLRGVLWLLAVMTIVTTFQRLYLAYRALGDQPARPRP